MVVDIEAVISFVINSVDVAEFWDVLLPDLLGQREFVCVL
jgi:hypothetical protein